MRKSSTVASSGKRISKDNRLTIGMDLGDRFSYYCVLDEACEMVVEQKLPTTKQALQRVFGRMC